MRIDCGCKECIFHLKIIKKKLKGVKVLDDKIPMFKRYFACKVTILKSRKVTFLIKIIFLPVLFAAFLSYFLVAVIIDIIDLVREYIDEVME